MRVVVVGASSGLGRCIGVGLGSAGEDVALLARREELLASAVEEIAQSGTDSKAHAVPCDVTDQTSVDAAIERSAEMLGGIDAVVYCTGAGLLRRLVDVDREDWDQIFATNVIGAHQITRAALPHLTESGGMAAYLTSLSASLTAPWPGLGAYAVSKAALDKLVDAWRAEHPAIGFTRVVVGECAGGDGAGMTQITASWDPDLAGELFGVWAERGLIGDTLMDVEHLVGAVHNMLQCGATATIPTVAITPRRPL